MMENAMGFRPDIEDGRWIIDTTHDSKAWQVIVEPDVQDELLVVITAWQS